MWRSVYTPYSLSGLLYLAPRSVPAPHHYTVGGHQWCFQSPFPAFSSFSFLVHSYNLPSYTKRLVPRYIQTRHKTTYKHKHKPASYYKRPTNLFIEKSELVVHLIRVCVCRISQQHAGGAGRSLPQDAERPSNHAAPPLPPPSSSSHKGRTNKPDMPKGAITNYLNSRAFSNGLMWMDRTALVRVN